MTPSEIIWAETQPLRDVHAALTARGVPVEYQDGGMGYDYLEATADGYAFTFGVGDAPFWGVSTWEGSAADGVEFAHHWLCDLGPEAPADAVAARFIRVTATPAPAGCVRCGVRGPILVWIDDATAIPYCTAHANAEFPW